LSVGRVVDETNCTGFASAPQLYRAQPPRARFVSGQAAPEAAEKLAPGWFVFQAL
jgi:hypothetical protein